MEISHTSQLWVGPTPSLQVILMKQIVEVFSDVICPWCYIGKRRLERALDLLGDRYEPDVLWRPFQLNPSMPPEGIDRRAYRTAKFGSWERSLELDARVAAAGAEVGITFAFDRIARTPNTFAAHRLIGYAQGRGQQDAMVEALFRAYFIEGRDIGERQVLGKLAADAGLDRAGAETFLAGDEGIGELRLEEERGRLLGIDSVPFFVIDERVGVAGAHDPEVVQRAIEEAMKRAGA
jgi:predicted DsbA family dithiol-disulfide isomerase